MNNKLKRPDGGTVENVHVAEVTTGQLIVYLCLGLCAFAFFFGLGVITGRLDPSFKEVKEEEAGKINKESAGVETYSIPALSPGAEGEKPAPASETTTSTDVQRTPETPTPRNPYEPATPMLTSVRLKPLPNSGSNPLQFAAPTKVPLPGTTPKEGEASEGEVPLPANVQDRKQGEAETPAASMGTPATVTPAVPASPPAASTPTTPASPPAAASPAAGSAAPSVGSAPQKTQAAPVPVSAQESVAPQLTPITPEEPPLEDLPLEPLSPEPAPAPMTTAAVSGKYSIQLAAFTGVDRNTRAEALRKKLNAEAGVQAQIITSADNQVSRVVVGGFPDKDSAEKALDGLRSKTGFTNAFVKAL